MKEMTLQKGSIVCVFLLIFLAFALLLVPTITADPIMTQMGFTDFESPGICNMKTPPKGIIVSYVAEEIFINTNESGQYPQDIAGILRCQTTISNNTGSAINYSGNSTIGCRSYFNPDDLTATELTEYWSQTISASGNATLTCHFKKTPK